MEKMILSRLQWVTGPLHPAVSAYTKGAGTGHCLVTLLTQASTAKTTAVFTDLEKAFELADKTVILSLLEQKGVGSEIFRLTRDFLTGREVRVLFQGHTSPYHHHERGTPQGSVLSPFLFSVLVEALTSTELSRNSQLLIYADDITLLNRNKNSLYNDLLKINARCKDQGLKINLNKTRAMTFEAAPPDHLLEIAGTAIAWANSYQYLGVWVESHLTFTPQVTYLRERLDTRLSVLRCMGNLQGGASLKYDDFFTPTGSDHSLITTPLAW